MSLSQSDLEYIEAKIKGELSPNEEANFNKRLSTDLQFKDHYEFMLTTIRIVEEQNQKAQKAVFNRIEEELSQAPTKKIKSKGISNWLKIAAAIILICAAIFLLRPNADLEVINFEHLPSNLSTDRSGSISSQSLDFEKAYNLYEIRSYHLAAPLLEQLFETERDTLSLLYAGIAYLGANDPFNAQKCLNNPALFKYPEQKQKYLDMIKSIKRNKRSK